VVISVTCLLEIAQEHIFPPERRVFALPRLERASDMLATSFRFSPNFLKAIQKISPFFFKNLK